MTSSSAASSRRSDVRELARGGSIILGGGVGGAVCTFLLLIVLARTSGSIATGLFFEALAVVSTCAIASAWGAGTTLAPRVASHLAHGRYDLRDLSSSALLPVLICSTVLAIVLATFHEPLSSAMTGSPDHQPELARLLLVVAPAIPMLALTRLFTSLARGAGAMGPSAWYDSGGQPLLRLLACGTTAALGAPLWVIGVAFTTVSVACLVAAVPHTSRSLAGAGATWGWRGWSGAEAWSFWAYSVPRGLEELFQSTNTWILVVLVGALASAAQAATYAAVSRSLSPPRC